jgi:murein DD-endopeptidase MepM/ murein hydrolase activator NlpD
MVREGVLRGSPAVMALLLCACIPRGAGDYSMSPPTDPAPPLTSSAPPPPTETTPQIVPEQAIIAPTPSWSPAVVERNAQRVNDGVYIVQSGDTLYRVEAKTGAGLSQIVSANALPFPYVLKLGQKLTIPGGMYHRVARGETGIAIARAYGVLWADIIALNTIAPPYVMREGQRLRLPENVAVTVITDDLSPEARAANFSLNIDDVVTGGEPALAQTGAPGTLSFPVTGPASFAGAFAWPVRGTLLGRFGSMGGGKVNDGINIAAAQGVPVKASAGGVIVYSGNEIGVFGGLVLIDHGGGWVTAYGHMGQLEVARGDKVAAGQPLGTVGDTGYVKQPQLHFEIRKDRKPVDPLTKL